MLLLLMKPFSAFFHSQLSICCMEGSTVLCAKTTFMTKTWNRSPKTSRERHGKCKVWPPNHTLCVTAPLHMRFEDAFIRFQPGAGICVTTNARIVPELNPAGSPDPTPKNRHGWTKYYKNDHVDNSRSEKNKRYLHITQAHITQNHHIGV